ncbi:MAG: hypothetical protein H0U70_05630 [Tatlockia sp.]|nr:hypothetical protein [Tatlockia sp.]
MLSFFKAQETIATELTGEIINLSNIISFLTDFLKSHPQYSLDEELQSLNTDLFTSNAILNSQSAIKMQKKLLLQQITVIRKKIANFFKILLEAVQFQSPALEINLELLNTKFLNSNPDFLDASEILIGLLDDKLKENGHILKHELIKNRNEIERLAQLFLGKPSIGLSHNELLESMIENFANKATSGIINAELNLDLCKRYQQALENFNEANYGMLNNLVSLQKFIIDGFYRISSPNWQ